MNNVFRVNGLFLRWALLLWIALLLGVLATGVQKEIVEPIYQGITAAGLIGLAAYGVFNIYYGVIKAFSLGEIILTAFALLLGGIGIATVAKKMATPTPLYSGGFIYLAGMVLLWMWARRSAQRPSPDDEKPERPLDDYSIRGGASVFQYGPDSYRLVRRNSTGSNTPAERFERKLIRHIEKSLEVEPVSRKGDSASYWSFRTPGGIPVELIVIGPGYNTTRALKAGQRWLLRIREPKPGFVADWLANYFPEGCAVVRDLGRSIQTQFSSSWIENDRTIFDKAVEVPTLGLKMSVEEFSATIERLENSRRGQFAESMSGEKMAVLKRLYIRHMCELINDDSGPSLLGTRADLFRAQMFVAASFVDIYPEMEGDEKMLFEIMDGIDLSSVCSEPEKVH